MDALSPLLDLAHLRVTLDVRCLLGGRFTIDHPALPPGEAVFHLLLSGRCRLRLNDGLELGLVAGDFVLLARGEAHVLLDDGANDAPQALRSHAGGLLPLTADGVASEAPAELLCGRYHHTHGAGALFSAALPARLHVSLLDSSVQPALSALMALLRAEVQGEAQAAGHAVIDALGQALLAYALRVFAQDDAVAGGLLPLAADRRLGASVRAVLDRPEHPWTIAELGNTVSMSRATYARHFQARAGSSVSDFLTRVRMMRACALLVETRRSLGDIAEAVGYRSEAAFGKAFHKALGETPGRWRRGAAERRAEAAAPGKA